MPPLFSLLSPAPSPLRLPPASFRFKHPDFNHRTISHEWALVVVTVVLAVVLAGIIAWKILAQNRAPAPAPARALQLAEELVLEVAEDLFEEEVIVSTPEITGQIKHQHVLETQLNPEVQLLVQKKYMSNLFHDSLGFGAAKMIRRIVGVTHIQDFESIADAAKRATCERRALELAKMLLKEIRKFEGIAEIISVIRQY